MARTRRYYNKAKGVMLTAVLTIMNADAGEISGIQWAAITVGIVVAAYVAWEAGLHTLITNTTNNLNTSSQF
ncbi:hypothetical protein [Ferrimicrobium acidiphilum]|uniref:hypothetical protein n=1 Tax=Ferrimicrobium acidiphilum TaxID=121039 RepID=UPI0023F0FDB5|nr:hypothetical protein [Ferrimicrobium acidiphilum]